MPQNEQEAKPSISRKKAMNLTDVDAVKNWWAHAGHGHFNEELYLKILKQKEDLNKQNYGKTYAWTVVVLKK